MISAPDVPTEPRRLSPPKRAQSWVCRLDRKVGSQCPPAVAKARGRLLSSRALLFPPSATPIDLSSIFSIQAIIEPFFALSTSTYARYNPATAALGSRVPSYTHFLRGDRPPIFSPGLRAAVSLSCQTKNCDRDNNLPSSPLSSFSGV